MSNVIVFTVRRADNTVTTVAAMRPGVEGNTPRDSRVSTPAGYAESDTVRVGDTIAAGAYWGCVTAVA